MGSTDIPKTMKAVQWDSKNAKLQVNKVPVPEPGHNQVLVKIASASLCHSDLMSIGTNYVSVDREKPVTIGHEGAGYVAKLHPSAEGKGFKIGDAIGFLYIIGCCFECEACQIHNMHCTVSQPHTQGFTFDGFFAEYALIDYHGAMVLPPEIDAKTASPLFCAGCTSFNCVESCELQPGQWLTIVGCGGLGQIACQYAKAMGYKVIGVDIEDAILQLTKKQGADHVFNSRTDKDYVQKIKDLTGGKGADTVAVFSAAAAAYRSAPPLVKLGGILLVVGLPDAGVTFNALEIAIRRYQVRGDSTGIPARMPKAINFTAKHDIIPELEVYHSLDDVAGMIKKMQDGKATKKMVVSFP